MTQLTTSVTVQRTRTALRHGWTTARETVPLPGRIVVGAAIGCLAAGLALGWSELAFAGVTLMAVLGIALAFTLGRTSYAVTVELSPRRVVVGERAMGRLEVRNSGARRLLPSRLELPVGQVTAEFQIPSLAPAADHEELFAVPTQRRALILAGPASSVRGDQLGLLRRTQRWTGLIELFVHPRTARLRATAHGLVRDLEGQPTRTITDSDLAFHALRPYEHGDSMRNVHWRTSARTGQLMVRQYQETRRSQLLLVLGAAAGHYASGDEFELAVSALASVGKHAIVEKNSVTAGWDEGTLRTRTPVALLDDSCRLEPVTGGRALREVVRRVASRRIAPSVVMLVVGSLTPPVELRSVATLYGPDTAVLALQADPSGSCGLRRVGPVTVATYSTLGDLAPMIALLGARS